MTRRLPAKTAGRRALKVTQAFSDDLLADENLCFDRITTAFRSGLDTRRAEVRRKGEPRALLAPTAITTVTDAWLRCAGTASHAVADLADTAVTKALDSIGEEVAILEQALAAKYRGISTEAVEIARGDVDTLVDSEMTLWEPAVLDAHLWLTGALRLQAGLARDTDELLLRWFSEAPAGLRGFGGRGVWWQATTGLYAVAREVSIHGANRARTTAMQMVNLLHEERRG